MKTLKRVAIVLYPAVGGGYVVYIPHFPECTTEGDTVEEALVNAKESLELALEVPTEEYLESLDLLNVDHVVVSQIEIEVPSLEASDAEAAIAR